MEKQGISREKIVWSRDQTLNHTGFRKICKKHDKILVRSTGSDFMSDVIGQAAFWTDKNLKRIINGLEDIMAGLEGGDMKKAMERLRRVFNLMLQGFQQPDCGDFRNMIAVQPDCSNLIVAAQLQCNPIATDCSDCSNQNAATRLECNMIG